MRAVFTGRHEAVSAPDYCLQKVRLLRVIVESYADLSDRRIDTLLYVDEDVFSPQCVGNLLAENELALILDQVHQQLQWHAFQAHRDSVAIELKLPKVEFEFSEADSLVCHGTCRVSAIVVSPARICL